MQAVRFYDVGGPEVLRTEDVEQPTPGAGQVRLRVAASAFNAADNGMRGGFLPIPIQLPHVPGYDVSGIVDALGDGVVYSRSGLTYQAQLLEQRGLVTRGPSPDDERSTVVTITRAGRDVLAAVFPGHIEALHTLLFASMSDADVDDLARILGGAAEHLRANPPRSAGARRRS